ncbi:serine aminopeptidase domain-containing protein [Aliikangiella coralliicola]|uniref:Serine aminopeptidase S33 domain-containing protein n=1 Tax=Aliikangiella coralliicola TaxID=2592383 RepID=A0A545UHF7_9GAMM|nr:alpha/beta hydrolase [Aliikangiella coralliicola]TQV88906.1 hypothetical protein FLL46_05055 [Aliikangiella coralliicola]
MTLKVVEFGPERNLVGILQTAEGASKDKSPKMVLMLNAGLVNKAGPFRMNAELANYLAKHQISSFRFDLSGIGDSRLPQNSDSNANERFLKDIEAAVDYLSNKFSNHEIVVLGLCTGADLAHKAIKEFPRIDGAVFLDGYSYRTLRFYLNRVLEVFSSPIRTIKLFFRIIKKLIRRLLPINPAQAVEDDADYVWDLPPKEDFIADLNSLYNRNAKLLYIYTGGDNHLYNYQNQLKDSIGKHVKTDNIDVIVNRSSDHTYILLEERQKLFKQVTDWLSAH